MGWLDRILGRSQRLSDEANARSRSNDPPKVGRRRRSHAPDPDADRVAAQIRFTDGMDLPNIAAGLETSPRAREILDALSRNRDMEVRGYVPGLAVQVLGHDALPLLIRMLRDSDPDNRGIALDAIERLDPEALRKLVPRLRRRLASLDDYEVLSTGWTLVRLRDQGAVPGLQSYLDAFRESPELWQSKAASVLLLALQHPDEVAATIRSHDHDRMMWLSYAAVVVGSPDCLDSLQWGAENLPDPKCQGFCKNAIERLAHAPRSVG